MGSGVDPKGPQAFGGCGIIFWDNFFVEENFRVTCFSLKWSAMYPILNLRVEIRAWGKFIVGKTTNMTVFLVFNETIFFFLRPVVKLVFHWKDLNFHCLCRDLPGLFPSPAQALARGQIWRLITPVMLGYPEDP